MIKHISALVGILAVFVTALLAYTNLSYFPMQNGNKLEEKVTNLESSINQKLDLLIKRTEK